jgi:hypothetical protein
MAIKAAAPPPTALNMLTSWGIAVIFTVRAEYSPAAAPMSAPAISTVHLVAVMVPPWMTSANTATTATNMPKADTWLPRRAVAGEFIRCRPRTKHTPPNSEASRTVISNPDISPPRQSAQGRPLAEHLEHPVGDHVAADHVGGGEGGGDEGQGVAQRAVDERRQDHHADEDDTVDGVGAGHQRGVQRRRHLADDLEAHQDRQHEDGQIAHKTAAHSSASNNAFVACCTTSPAVRDDDAGLDFVVQVNGHRAVLQQMHE